LGVLELGLVGWLTVTGSLMLGVSELDATGFSDPKEAAPIFCQPRSDPHPGQGPLAKYLP